MSGFFDTTGRDEPTDYELLRNSVTDPEAFGQFYDRHFKMVMNFFCRRTSDPHQAADLTAETFAKALLSCHRFQDRGEGSGPKWLYGIARHELSGMYRKHRVRNSAMEKLRISAIPLDDYSLERIERLIDAHADITQLRAALNTLPRSQADAVTLRIGHDLSFKEVASRLGCSTAAARRDLDR